MPEKVFKKISVTGCSTENYEKAIKAALEKARRSVHGLSWFEVQELRGSVDDQDQIEYQASVEVAFLVD